MRAIGAAGGAGVAADGAVVAGAPVGADAGGSVGEVGEGAGATVGAGVGVGVEAGSGAGAVCANAAAGTPASIVAPSRVAPARAPNVFVVKTVTKCTPETLHEPLRCRPAPSPSPDQPGPISPASPRHSPRLPRSLKVTTSISARIAASPPRYAHSCACGPTGFRRTASMP